VPSHAGYPVRVAVKGHGYRGVPEKVLYEFRVDAAPQKEGSAGVPEVVEAHGVGETGLLEEGLEVAAVEVVAVDGRADLRGEDQPVVLPEFPEARSPQAEPRGDASVPPPL
jgi:hypothetical protein